MKNTTPILLSLFLVLFGLAGTGCGKKTPEIDAAYYQSPEGTFYTIQQVRLQLTEALEKKNLRYIHDNIYYFKNLCAALSAKLQGEKKQRVDAVLAEINEISEEIDNSAGRGNQSATEANLQKLIDELKALETEFKLPKKK